MSEASGRKRGEGEENLVELGRDPKEFDRELRMGRWSQLGYWLSEERPQQEKDEALLKAAMEGNRLRMGRLAAAGANPNGRIGRGVVAPLLQILARQGGSEEGARELQRLGARADDSPGPLGPRAADVAAGCGHGHLLEALTERAPEEARKAWLDSALRWAAMGKGEGVIRRLVAMGADPNGGDDAWGGPLRAAAEFGSAEGARELLRLGADPGRRGGRGEAPLHWAAKEGKLETVEALLEFGADGSAKDKDGETALHWAAREGREEVAMVLLERGADASERSERTGARPEEEAKENGRLACEAAIRSVRVAMEEREALDAETRGGGERRKRGL